MLNKVECLVVDGAVHNTLGCEEATVDEEVAEECTCHKDELIGSYLIQLGHLNSALLFDIL